MIVTPITSSWGLFRRLWREYFGPHPRILVLGGVCMLLSAVATAILATYFKPLFDDIFMAHQKVAIIVAGILGISVLKGASEYGAVLCMEYLSQSITRSFQEKLFVKILSFPLHFFHQHHRGNLTSLLVQDVRVLRESVSSTISNLLKEGLSVVALLVVMVRENATLSILTFLGLPLIFLPLIYSGRYVRALTGGIQKDASKLHVFFQQIFHNILLVKASHTEAAEIKGLQHRLDGLFFQTMRVSRAKALIHPIMEILGAVAILMVVIYSGLYQKQSAGSFLAFLTALFFIYRPIKSLVSLNTQLQEGLAVAGRLFECMEMQETSVVPLALPNSRRFFSERDLDFTQPIRFERITFSYPGESTPILQDFSATFDGHKRLALVGPSGAGKTSLLYLLLRFYYPQSGTIYLGNIDIQTIPLAAWHRRLAFVSQDVMLFDDTLANNIRYGMPNASEEEIRTAAEMANAQEFIEKLPLGYNTIIGENGMRLSGGQRQRIALARAFLRDAPLLLLDEATSALDTFSEQQIQKALQRLTEHRTTLNIAHRLSTIKSSDKIFVLEHGSIVEQGTHEELLAFQGAYARLALLYTLQDEVAELVNP